MFNYHVYCRFVHRSKL